MSVRPACFAGLPARTRHLRALASRRARGATVALLAAAGAGLLLAGLWTPAKAELAQWLLERAWTATGQSNARTARPWPWADTSPVARLYLPGHEPLTVLGGASGRNLAFAPGHLTGSALPGEPGVSVIAGHRDTHFRELGTLEPGDRFTIERPDGTRRIYEVTGRDVVDARRAELRLDADEPIIALVTCYPFDAAPGTPMRYVITARLAGA